MSNRAVDLVGAWTGVAIFIVAIAALTVIGDFIPPRDPSISDVELARWYVENVDAARVGTTLMSVAFVAFAPFGFAIISRLRQVEQNLTVGQFAMAAAILAARSPAPFPRWSGYLSLWAGVTLMPGSAVLFFKTGPLAYNGLVGLYVPTVCFFIWMVAMTYLLFKPNPAEFRP